MIYSRLQRAEEANKELHDNGIKTILQRLDRQDVVLEQLTQQQQPSKNPTVTVSNLGTARKVRSFQLLPQHDHVKNLILGSSIVARIPKNDLPYDTDIQAYPGSSTDEKKIL